MLKLSDFENKAVLSTPSGVRQVIKAAKLDDNKKAEFIFPDGDGSTRIFSNFEELTALGGVVDLAAKVKPTNKGWMFYGGASLATDWFRFGSKALKLGTSSQYCQLTENLIQYKDCPNGWTEEFVFRMDSLTSGVNLFRCDTSSSAACLIINHNKAGKLVLYLSSSLSASSYDIASAVVIPGLTMVNGGVYHIAISYNPQTSTYTLFVNGTALYSKVSSKLVATFNRKIFGWSGGIGVIGRFDEYKFSNSVIYQDGYTVPDAPFVIQRGSTVTLKATVDDPLEISYSDGLKEWHSSVINDVSNISLMATGRNYIYAELDLLDKPTFKVTKIPPQYGVEFDKARHSLLNFQQHGEVVAGTGYHACPDSRPEIDQYGNVWTLDPAAILSRVDDQQAFLPFTSVAPGTPCLSDIWSLPETWSIELGFDPDTAASTGTLFSYGGNVSGVGIRLDIVTAGTSFTVKVYLSTDGASWNVANNIAVAGGVIAQPAGQAHKLKLSYDGAEFRLEMASGASMSWPSLLPIAPTWGSRIELGRWATASFWKGNLYEFQLKPYSSLSGEPLEYHQISSGMGSQISADIHYFDIIKMKMFISGDGEGTAIDAIPSSTPGEPIVFNKTARAVFLGEVVIDADNYVIDTVSYAVDGIYRSGWYPVSTNYEYPILHNLGTTELDVTNYINQVPSNNGKREEMGVDATRDSGGNAFYIGCTREKIMKNSLTMSLLGSGSLVQMTATPLGGENINAFYNTTIKRSF